MARWLTLFTCFAALFGILAPPDARGQPPVKQKADNKAALRVIESIKKAADDNAAVAQPLKGDELTQLLVRAAATAADKEAAAVKVDAFLTGLGVGIDRQNYLAENVATRGTFGGIETAAAAKVRKESVKKFVTIYKKADLTEHYACSVGLTSRLGGQAAETAGLLKEQKHLAGKSGWSWRKVQANAAGIQLAERVKSGDITLADVATKWTTATAVPDLKGLPEDLQQAEFKDQFGEVGGAKSKKLLAEIKESVKTHLDTHWGEVKPKKK